VVTSPEFGGSGVQRGFFIWLASIVSGFGVSVYGAKSYFFDEAINKIGTGAFFISTAI